MRAAARKGLEYYEEGLGGDGLVERTIREARAMASGSVTADKWVRIRAWIARHLGDLDAPAANPDSPEYPSAGVVAHLLWGSGPSKQSAERALAFAEGVVARLEEENSGRARGKNLAAIEHRTNLVDYEIRDTAEGMTFEGYAAIFDSPSHPLPFEEKIAPGAFLRSLKSRNDIKLLWNHDTGSVLGSTRAGTLRLIEDAKGLKVRAELPNTSAGRDAAELLRRGDVDAMSFGFTVPKGGEEWSADGRQRTLREVMLHEVSIVAFPAYAETAGTATVRALDKIAARANVDVDALADALLKLETGEDFTVDDRNLLNRVIEEITPETEASEDSKGDYAMLSLKKKKLELLLGA
jgi:HK97 family phage prohead protease